MYHGRLCPLFIIGVRCVRSRNLYRLISIVLRYRLEAPGMTFERELMVLEEDDEPAIYALASAAHQGLVAYDTFFGQGRMSYRQVVTAAGMLAAHGNAGLQRQGENARWQGMPRENFKHLFFIIFQQRGPAACLPG